MQNIIDQDIITELIKNLERYKFEFNEDEVKCELFNLLKKRGNIVRAEHPKKFIRHDLVVLNKELQIRFPIEIKSRENYSFKKAKGYLFGDDVCGGCDSIFLRHENNKDKQGAYIFINFINDVSESIINNLKQINFDDDVCLEYDFISIYYLEFINKEFMKFNNGLLIKNKEIKNIILSNT